jgi:hypothetical protein
VVREELQECAQVQGPPHGRENQQEREEKQGKRYVDYAMVVTHSDLIFMVLSREENSVPGSDPMLIRIFILFLGQDPLTVQ